MLRGELLWTILANNIGSYIGRCWLLSRIASCMKESEVLFCKDPVSSPKLLGIHSWGDVSAPISHGELSKNSDKAM